MNRTFFIVIPVSVDQEPGDDTASLKAYVDDLATEWVSPGVNYDIIEEDAPTTVYVVAWSGGYEAPSYMATQNEGYAWDKAHEWASDIDPESGDTVDLLKVTIAP